jgi:hypothetical protein
MHLYFIFNDQKNIKFFSVMDKCQLYYGRISYILKYPKNKFISFFFLNYIFELKYAFYQFSHQLLKAKIC